MHAHGLNRLKIGWRVSWCAPSIKRELSDFAGHGVEPTRRANSGGGGERPGSPSGAPAMRISRKESIAFDMARGAANR